MIRYPHDPAEAQSLDLNARAEAEKRGWLARAATRIANFDRAGRYDESEGIWSEIKGAWMTLQLHKCAYCERRLTDPRGGGSLEHALEHYRPKAQVQPWPDARAIERLTDNTGRSPYRDPLGAALPGGYYLLAYHTGNYVTSCGVCNSYYKRDYFPIAGPRATRPRTPQEAATELPLLLHPLGTSDEDPATLIRFVGTTPVPVFRSGPRRRRARVTIDFFNLHGREDLIRERADIIISIARAYADAVGGTDARRRRRGEQDLRRMLSPASAHSNCANCFYRLLASSRQAERDRAESILDEIYGPG